MKLTDEFKESAEDYRRIERAIRFLEINFKEQPNLDKISQAIHLSKYHFHRLFKRWAGVTPLQFLQYLTVEYSKNLLREFHSVLDVSLAAGLSSSSRLHDLFITVEAITPGEYKKLGSGLEITYGFHPTPFGECLLATTHRGICSLRFISPYQRDEVLKQLRGEWPKATFIEQPAITLPYVHKLFSKSRTDPTFHLTLKGTNFQMQVWKSLLTIPLGARASYQDVAMLVGKPNATRAVASAIARNPISYLIPCHRVISKTGKINKYRWGTTRKRALLGWEASQANAQTKKAAAK